MGGVPESRDQRGHPVYQPGLGAPAGVDTLREIRWWIFLEPVSRVSVRLTSEATIVGCSLKYPTFGELDSILCCPGLSCDPFFKYAKSRAAPE
jgi:hypothetical protein